MFLQNHSTPAIVSFILSIKSDNVVPKRWSVWKDNCPVKDEYVIRLERDDARMILWMVNVRSKDRSFREKLGTTPNVNSMKGCSQGRRLYWFYNLERMEGNEWASKCRTFTISGSFPRRWPRKTWNVASRSDLKE